MKFWLEERFPSIGEILGWGAPEKSESLRIL